MWGIRDDIGGHVEVVALVDRRVAHGVLVHRGHGLVRAEVERQRRVVVGERGVGAPPAAARPLADAAGGVVLDAVAQAVAEADLVEQRLQRVQVGVGPAQRVPVQLVAVGVRQRDVGQDGDELFAQPRVVGVVAHALAGALALEVAGVLDQRLDGPVLVDKLDGRLLADAGHAGHVVGGVAHERQQVHELGRLQAAVLLAEGLGRLAVERLAHVGRAEHGDAVGEQLAEVFVRREDDGVDALVLGAARERPDHVVGLDALDLQDGDVEALHQPLDERDVGLDLGRHGRPVAFVVVVELVAEGGLAAELVEDHGDVLGLLVLQELEERRREAVERPRVGPVGGVEAGVLHREEGPVGERHRVGEEQGLARVAVGEVVHARVVGEVDG